MNKIFKVIWNPATGSYSVASETAKSRGKKSGRSKLLISALVAGGLLSSFGASADNYTGQPTDYGDGSAGDGWVAIGKGSKANTFINTSGASTALGYDAIAEGEYSSAIGSKTLASGGASMAFGVSAKALGDRSVALGASSTATGDRSMALGRYAKTNGFTSLAVGDSSLADGEKTIALGNTAKAYEIMSIALGDNANASKEYSMALGASSAASAANAIAVGRNSAAAGVDSLALGRQSLASAANAITIGAESEAAENATAVGTKAKARGKNSLALGANSDSTGEGSVALGYTAAAAGASALALGQNAQASNTNTIALGQNSSASTANAIAIGTGSSAVGSNSLALGSSSSAGGNNSVAIGASSTADEDNVVSVGSGSAQRRIVNMAAGEISTDSKEAINGSQLYAISRSVADRLGGGADVASNGTIKGMSYKLKKRDFNNVGEALQYLDNETLHWDSAKGAFSASYIVKNADGTIASTVAENKIINVKDGDISATSKDAINGSQLKTTNDNVATNTTNITNLTDSVGDLKDDALLWNGTAFSAAHGTDATSKITNVKDGDLTAGSTDAVNGSQLKTTNDAVAANTTNIATNTTNITNLTDAVDSLGDDSLLWNATAGAFSAAHGTDATSKITNVKDGDLTAGSTDAVNGSQLKTTNDAVAANTTNIATNTTNITNLTDAVDSLGDDSLLWNDAAKAFSAAHGTDATSKITNVKDGDLTAGSTDAVNGSQLKTTNDAVTANTTNIATNTTNITNLTDAVDSLGDDSLLWNATAGAFSAAHGTDATSKITNVKDGDLTAGSTDAVNGSQLKTTNDAVAANTTNIATNTTNITNLTDAVDSLGDDSLLWNATAGAFSAAHGTDATSKITNVKDGDLTAGSTDAVNGSQLKTTNDNVATNTTNIATNTTNITNLTDAVDSLGDDSLLWNATAGAFSAAHCTDATSKITNVKDGDLTAGSTDAVNGSQLKTTNDNVATNTTNIATNTTNITNLTDAVDSLGDDSLLWNATAGAFSAKHGTNGTDSKITNLLAGTVSSDSTDAINGSQLYGLADSFTSYLGGGADISDAGVLTGPTYTIGGTDYNNVGDALAAINTSFSTSLGDALLWDATAKGGDGAFSAGRGKDNTASIITNVADGAISSTSSDAINGSQLYDTSKYIADTLGGDAEVNADGTITAPTYAIAGGSYSNVGDALEAIDTTLDDALLWDATANDGNGAFSAAHGKDKTASVITNVANGAISATSSDAINGSQLYTTNKYIADALGGDAEVNADGSITAPTYTIANAEYNNVGDALDALDDNALLWDATANDGAGAYNASHDGKASIITNVADGNIGEGSTDAINGSQLFNTNMLIQQNSEIINQLAGNTSETYIEDNGAGINYVRTNDNGLAFNDASASGIGATAVGYNAVASGESSVAIGQGSSSSVDTGIALGSSSVSSRVIVKGSRDTSVSEEGVVIGYDTTDGELLGALSIGDDGKYRQIINVADGSEAHDAVTVRQLQNAIGAVATTPTKYFHANSTAEDSLAVGEDSLAMGAKTIVNGDAGIGIGLNTLVLTDAINGIAIGSNASANHANSIAMGSGSQTTRGAQTDYTAYNMDAPQNSVGEFSVGSEDGQRQITNVAAGSADTDAVNVGQLKVTDERVAQNTQSITNLNNQVTNLDTRVTNIENGIGDIVTTGSTKYFKTNTDGVDANAQGKDSVAIGSGSIAAADNSVALGTGSVANEENTISVGSSTNQRRITNVAAGVNATDAVNVSQLKSSEAGGVRYDTKADGSIDYSNITLGGGNGGTTRINNVSAGVNNNDAVNYAQLKQSVQETKQYTDQRMVEMDNKLSKTESKLSGGIASAMAMTGLPQAYTPGASMASIGGGTYNGESAVALGVSMVSANGRWVYKLQGSTNSQGEYSAALGAGIQW
ncbi:YadA-like family protein [Escherichia coli]|uniref:YadA-like family protein n=4 Tax=Escherichia coli TaxID=562 RepID=UPI002237D8A4|nr:YadA-like family protein [Escherichia coli]MCW7091395.1 YadA-like family protein [Escherichia coli]WCP87184.1 YadA-like family protein [Escherichia coli]WCP94282.1 YadA-like family protein [Escherichia coli]